MNDGAGRFLVLVVAAMALVLPNQKAASDLQPTNRLSLTATHAEVLTVPLVSGTRTSPIALLRDSMNLSARADLVVRVAAECGLYTDVVGIGHVSSASSANVDVWLEVDGRPVTVTGGPGAGNESDVVFADREFALTPLQFDDPAASATMFEKTHTVQAHNWVVLGLEPGVHRVVVMGRLRANATLPGRVKAMVGRRALVAVPTSLATDALF